MKGKKIFISIDMDYSEIWQMKINKNKFKINKIISHISIIRNSHIL